MSFHSLGHSTSRACRCRPCADPFAYGLRRKPADLAQGSSFSLLMVFFSCIFYKYAALTATEDLQDKMSMEQRAKFIVPNVQLQGSNTVPSRVQSSVPTDH